jgi:flagellin
MPIVVNSNVTATTASFNLSSANDALRNSLARLSSGKRIVNPADDAGGMAVAYKLQSKLQRTEAVRQNVQNGLSYLQAQDGALKVMGKVLDRMSELRTMAQDITKNTGDIENYSKEFIELQRQLSQTAREKFNGISLFASSSASSANNPLRPQLSKGTTVNDEGVTVTVFSRTVYTNPSGQASDGNVSIGVINLENLLDLGGFNPLQYYYTGQSIADPGVAEYSTDPTIAIREASTEEMNSFNAMARANPGFFGGFQYPLHEIEGLNLGNIGGENDIHSGVHTSLFTSDGFLSSILFISVGQFTSAIERLADARAENGAEQARLNMSNELLIHNQTNLEAAYGRIMDADIALESTRFARQNVLVQSSAAMVAQANQLTSIALTILG